MKSRLHLKLSSSGLLALLVLPVGLSAQGPKPAHYTVTDLGTLGGSGTNSTATEINNAGWVAGSSNLTAGGPQHAFLWYGGGRLHDLGTLNGSACPACNSGADGPNLSGEAAVSSETSTYFGSTGEDFCSFGTHRQCLGAIWKNRALKALPTLKCGSNSNGCKNASAFDLNNRGQVIGFAENGILDPTCAPGTLYQLYRFEAVIWGPDGEIRQLQPYGSDTVAFGFGINDNGQAVGSSGLCSNTSLPPLNPAGEHAVLWESDGTPTDLGNLGGTYNVASSINNRGVVVGGAMSPIDGTVHAFRWSRETGMQDFGAFPGAVITVAPCCRTINDRGEMVGWAINGTTFNSTALVWQGKVPVDLNTLIPKDSGWYLQGALSINDAGEIVGYGLIDGNLHAFRATPCDR
jgi:probable HAF family extracellular repeat protein